MTSGLPQRVVSFYEDELIGVQNEDGIVYAPFGRLCDNLGLGRDGQLQRIRRHAVLAEALVALTVGTAGGPQEIQCLRVDVLPLWLAGIQASRVKEELREKLIRYQREVASVLWLAFRDQVMREEAPQAQESSFAISQLEQIVEQSRAMQRMAEEQIAIIRRMDVAARMVKGLQTNVADIQVRLGVLEDKVNPAAYITDAQAAEVSTKVKALAELLTKNDPSKNHYQGIFAEVYRRFSVSSYKMLRREQFEGVLAFLEEWRLAGE